MRTLESLRVKTDGGQLLSFRAFVYNANMGDVARTLTRNMADTCELGLIDELFNFLYVDAVSARSRLFINLAQQLGVLK